jgi:DedD protein
MAERKAAEDDFNPRHRIIGAVILVALAVIFLPMLLSDHPPASHSTGGGELPTADTRVVTVPVPLPGDKPDAGRRAAGSSAVITTPSPARTVAVPVEPVLPAPIDETAPAEDSTAPVTAPSPSVKKTESAPARASAPTAKPAAGAASISSPAGKWVIQAGAFSQLENARHLQERLRQKGFAATLDPANPAHGKTVKVLVGPYPDAAAAKAAAARLHSELGIQGIVRSR